jgi:hypothetical protein
MLPVEALKSMRVMFATPCYISAVTMNYVASIFNLTCEAMRLGLPCMLHLHSESLIPRGRNKIVLKFLAEEEFTHLFWIDSDIAFEARSALRLLLADRDIAAGVYPMKSEHWPAQRSSLRHDSRAVRNPLHRISLQPDRAWRGACQQLCRSRGLR